MILFFFLSLFTPDFFKRFKKLLFFQLVLGLFSFFSYIFLETANIHAVMVIISLVFCLSSIYYIYFKELHEDKYRNTVLIVSFALSISVLPYLLFNLLPIYVFQIDMPYSFYQLIYLFIIIFPPVIIYQFEQRIGLRKDAFHRIRLVFNIIYFCLCYLILFISDVTFNDFIMILYMIVSLYFVYKYIQNYVVSRREKYISQHINPLKDTKSEVELEILSNKRFENVANLLVEILDQEFQFDGVAISWSYHTLPHFIHKKGKLTNLSLKIVENKLVNSNDRRIDLFGDNTLFQIPFIVNDQKIGMFYFLLNDEKEASIKFEYLRNSVASIGNILYTTQVLFEKQESFRKNRLSNLEREVFLKQLNLELDAKIKLANYLHDDILQTILALKNMITILDGPQAMKDMINQNFEDMITSLRSEMIDIFPSFLYQTSIEDAIGKLIEKLSHSFYTLKIDFDVKIDIRNPLSVKQKYFFYKTIRELVTNVFKHSKCDKCEISLKSNADHFILNIFDNGIGLDIDDMETQEDFYYRHVGILRLKQEVNYRNGTFNIYSKKDRYTKIELFLPIIFEE